MASKKTANEAAPWDKPAPRKAKHTSLTSAQKKHAAARAKKAGRSYPNLVDNMHEAAASGGTGKKASKRKAAAKKAPAKKSSTKSTTKKTRARKSSTKNTSKKTSTKKSSTKRASKKSAAKKGSTKRAAKKSSRGRSSTERKTAPARSAAKKTASKRAGAGRKAAGKAKKSTQKRAPARKKSAAAYTARRPRAGKRAAEKDPRGGLTAAGRRAFHERDGANLKPGVTKPQSQMTPEDMKRKGSWAVRFYGRAGKLPPLVDEAGKPTRLALTAAAWGESVPKTEAQARRIADKGHRLLERARKARS